MVPSFRWRGSPGAGAGSRHTSTVYPCRRSALWPTVVSTARCLGRSFLALTAARSGARPTRTPGTPSAHGRVPVQAAPPVRPPVHRYQSSHHRDHRSPPRRHFDRLPHQRWSPHRRLLTAPRRPYSSCRSHRPRGRVWIGLPTGALPPSSAAAERAGPGGTLSGWRATAAAASVAAGLRGSYRARGSSHSAGRRLSGSLCRVIHSRRHWHRLQSTRQAH